MHRDIESLSLYETGITVEYGDSFITLVTCAYHTKEQLNNKYLLCL